MDMSAFKLDIDELINDFAMREMKTVADMKKVWLERKFTYIFEARPSTNQALFMQSLYDHSISHLNPANSLSQRLGGLYCFYCLYETQPFKPPFKIYLSLGELRRLKALVVDAKQNRIKVVFAVVKRMLEKNAFLFGSVNLNEYSEKERIKELVDAQNACIQKMHAKLFTNTDIERYLHMDLGMELDQKVLQKMSTEYAATKSLAFKEASEVVDVKNIKHIAEDQPTIGDEMQDIIEEWDAQKELLAQQTRSNQHHVEPHPERGDSSAHTNRAPVPNAEAEQWLDDDDNLQQNRSFMEMLMGDASPPQANGNVQHTKEDHQDDLDYAKELENYISEDAS